MSKERRTLSFFALFFSFLSLSLLLLLLRCLSFRLFLCLSLLAEEADEIELERDRLRRCLVLERDLERRVLSLPLSLRGDVERGRESERLRRFGGGELERE